MSSVQVPLSRQAEAALWAISAMDTRAQPPDFAVLRVPSIVENYVDSILELLANEYLAGESPFEHALGQLARERLHQSWPSRREWLRESFAISVDGDPVDQDFALLVQLRNAVAHGSNALTRLQRGKLSEQLELERNFYQRLEVLVDGYRFRTTRGTAAAAGRVGSRFIRLLDAQASPVLRSRGLS